MTNSSIRLADLECQMGLREEAGAVVLYACILGKGVLPIPLLFV
jgi:hypothetical protein